MTYSITCFAAIQARRLRRQTKTKIIKSFDRSCKSMKTKHTLPNGTVNYDFSHLKRCVKLDPKDDHWDLACLMKDGTCFYFVTCEFRRDRPKRILDWVCKEVHKSSDIPACCDYTCHV